MYFLKYFNQISSSSIEQIISSKNVLLLSWLGDIKLWAGHMFDENYEVPTKPPLYLFEGTNTVFYFKDLKRNWKKCLIALIQDIYFSS